MNDAFKDENYSMTPKLEKERILYSISKKIKTKVIGIFHKSMDSEKELGSTDKKGKRFLGFIKLLILVLRSVKEFQWRTKFRKLNFLTNRQISFINDLVYISEDKTQKNKFYFIRSKFLRLKLLVLRKKFKNMMIIIRKKI